MGDKSRQLPTLAPGPRAGATSAVPTSRPKKNSTACLACKQAKRKCSGRPSPCRACEAAESECIFDETLDLRRKVAVKRTADELEYYKDLVNSILETLRSPDQTKVDRLLTIIRSDAPLSDIAAAVSTNPPDFHDRAATDTEAVGMGALDDPAALRADLLRRPAEASSRRGFMTLDKLCDIPLFNVPAKPWTNVTDDEEFVSHLVSLYFTWNHPFEQFIDQQLFLQDMASGNPDSQFCSPFLVNSLLAVASTYSDFPEAFASPGDVSTRGQHFHAEADRLWKAGEGKVTLPIIQGLLLMVLTENFRGKDSIARQKFRQAIELAHNLGLFSHTPGSTSFDQEEASVEMERARASCACGIAILNSQMAMASLKVTELNIPVCRPYEKDEPDDGVMWTPYPRSNQIDYAKKPALLKYIRVAMLDLAEILVETQALLFDKAFRMGFEDLWQLVNVLYARLQIWQEALPDVLDIGELPVPQVLLLRMFYHWTVVMLFGIFGERQDFSMMPFSQAERAQENRIHSAKEIARCSRIHRQSYGLNHAPSHMVHPISTGLFALLNGLNDTGSQEAFIELSRHLSALSRRIVHCKVIIRNLESRAQQSSINLPPDAVAVFRSHDPEAVHDAHS